MNLNAIEIEKNLKKLINEKIEKKEFIYKFLLAYGLPKASIKRLKDGNINLSQKDNEISWKRKLFFKEIYNNDLHVEITKLENQIKHEERFIIVTNFKEFLAIDTKTKDRLDIDIKDLVEHYDFFLPWAGMEKAKYHLENPADVRAAEKMAKLFDEIKKNNSDNSSEFVHGLNIFLSRLLFCFFAEDTNIFSKSQFTNSIISHTQKDGSDLDLYLEKLFEVFNTDNTLRSNIPEYLNDFPYVNGGLFKEKIKIPKFTKHSRQAIIETGKLDWSAINPDIFGSMFQCVISKEKRRILGMHYTSVPNIMKIINPLFLDELNKEFETICGNNEKLNKFLLRIRNIKIFDPACGSGNFLIIAYKELRKLEMKIFEKAKMLNMPNISLSNFYGIEIDDFAHEIAKLSLWLSEHQMNIEFFKKFGRTNPTLPLKEAGKIVCGNAMRLDWKKICSKDQNDEIYILGNPPYLGSSMQNKDQKNDMSIVFNNFKSYKNLDYITCWLKKGADFIYKTKFKLSFVATVSICQGDQVAMFWPYIFKKNLEINFAYSPFMWKNNARSKAGVNVTIIGLRNKSKEEKYFYNNSRKNNVKNINGYLTIGENIIIEKQRTSISNLPLMIKGNQPTDGGNFILTPQEKDTLLKKEPDSKKFLKKYMGSSDFIRGYERYCIWIEDKDIEDSLKIPEIVERIKKVKEVRSSSKSVSTRNFNKGDHRFIQIQNNPSSSIIIPSVSSERREYIPMGFLDENTVISNLAFAIYNPDIYIFSILSSKIHNLWVRAVAGYLGTSIRYSNVLCYNTFPFPRITKKQKEQLTESTFKILEVREKYPEKTLAELYDPDKMPEGLKEAHRLNDVAVEKCYRSKPFESDEERLGYLFKMYERMIKKEKK